MRVGWLDCRQGAIILKENTSDNKDINLLDKYLELNKTELSLPRLLIDQVVVVLRRDVERVAFLRIELKWKAFMDSALRTFYHDELSIKKKK